MKDNLPKARALTRNEIKALRKAGLDPVLYSGEMSIKVSSEMVDWILDHVYPEYDFSDMAYPDCLTLATQTYQMTYAVGKDEIKNS